MPIIDRLVNYSDDSILDELRRVAKDLGKPTLAIKDLRDARLSYALLKKRFGGLRQALKLAGMRSPEFHRDVPEEELLRELKRIWDVVLENEGRRPFKKDLDKYNSKYSQGPYYRTWGSWIKACEALLEWSEQNETQDIDDAPTQQGGFRQRRGKPRRPIPLRMRYEVLKRDRFTCVLCGRSPATSQGIQLHVDHIKAESKGGLPVFENLRTLCADCNIGKGNT